MGKHRNNLERWLNKYNHIMELMRTILVLTMFILQIYIITELLK